MQTQSVMVDVPGGQVFVQRSQPASATSGAACPIVLLHESLGSVGQWHDFPAQLAQATGREVLAYDPSTGLEDWDTRQEWQDFWRLNYVR